MHDKPVRQLESFCYPCIVNFKEEPGQCLQQAAWPTAADGEYLVDSRYNYAHNYNSGLCDFLSSYLFVLCYTRLGLAHAIGDGGLKALQAWEHVLCQVSIAVNERSSNGHQYPMG